MNAPEVRDAATVMVVRDKTSDDAPAMEVLLVRRRATSSFGAGAHVFPGGAVDVSDRDAVTSSLVDGHDDRTASKLLGVPAGGLGFFVAAIRECFEEAGLLFAEDASGLLSLSDPATRERFAQHRRQLNLGAATIASICQAEGLRLPAGRLGYFSHWTTPPGGTRRFATRFFVGIAPEGQVALHDENEVVASEWVIPAEALKRHREKLMELMFPTVKHLEALAAFSGTEELWRSLPAEVPSIEPRISVEDRRVKVLMPGEPGFDEATGLPDGVALPDGAGPIELANG